MYSRKQVLRSRKGLQDSIFSTTVSISLQSAVYITTTSDCLLQSGISLISASRSAATRTNAYYNSTQTKTHNSQPHVPGPGPAVIRVAVAVVAFPASQECGRPQKAPVFCCLLTWAIVEQLLAVGRMARAVINPWVPDVPNVMISSGATTRLQRRNACICMLTIGAWVAASLCSCIFSRSVTVLPAVCCCPLSVLLLQCGAITTLQLLPS